MKYFKRTPDMKLLYQFDLPCCLNIKPVEVGVLLISGLLQSFNRINTSFSNEYILICIIKSKKKVMKCYSG